MSRSRATASALTLIVPVVAACSGDAPPSPTLTPDDLAVGLRPAVQIEGEAPVTFDLRDRMAHYNVPGVSVALLEDGEITWARGWGVADSETGRPVDETTLFQAASISKPVAALTAMTLVYAGRVDLDAPVNDYLTSWQVPDNEFTADSTVTLRGLLSHTAGLTVWGFPGYRKDEPFDGDRMVATNAEVLDGLGNTDSVRVYREPGIGWQYSGGGYTVMEQLVEDVTGEPFAAAARRRVLGPVGMTRSTFEQPLPEDRWAEASRAHDATGTEVPGEWHSYPEQAAAGLWTTPTELLTLSRYLIETLAYGGDGIISLEQLREMWTAHRGDEEGFTDYGLGFSVIGEGDDLRIGHGGSNRGFKAQWTFFPNRSQGIAVMTNGERGAALMTEIVRAAATAFGWPGLGSEEVRIQTLSAEELAAFAGVFQVADRDLSVTVAVGDGALTLDVPQQGVYTLRALADTSDLFVDLEDGQRIRFERDDRGAVTGMVAGGQTRLERVE